MGVGLSPGVGFNPILCISSALLLPFTPPPIPRSFLKRHPLTNSLLLPLPLPPSCGSLQQQAVATSKLQQPFLVGYLYPSGFAGVHQRLVVILLTGFVIFKNLPFFSNPFYYYLVHTSCLSFFPSPFLPFLFLLSLSFLTCRLLDWP